MTTIKSNRRADLESPQEFVIKWRNVQLKERSAAQQHFLIRLLFCLFAEDIGLLPKDLFTPAGEPDQKQRQSVHRLAGPAFQSDGGGGWLGVEQIIHFNGGLFDDDDLVLELDSDGLRILAKDLFETLKGIRPVL